MEQEQDKKLEDIRYDEKLFNQVYRAGLKAKEVEEKELKKKKLYRIYLVGGIVLFLAILIILNPFRKKVDEYILANQETRYAFSDIGLPDVLEEEDYPDLSTLELTGKSIVVYDVSRNKVIFSREPDMQLQIASLTKIMTAIVSYKLYSVSNPVIKIENTLPSDYSDGLSLEVGDSIEYKEALKGFLINSYNNLAYIVGIQNPEFVSLMNVQASILGLKNTHFADTVGLDNPDNYSSAMDMTKLSLVFLKYPSLLEITDTYTDDINWVKGDGTSASEGIKNTNVMLVEREAVKGIKTGYTEDALQCLVTYYETEDFKYLITVIGSEDRFADTRYILNELQ